VSWIRLVLNPETFVFQDLVHFIEQEIKDDFCQCNSEKFVFQSFVQLVTLCPFSNSSFDQFWNELNRLMKPHAQAGSVTMKWFYLAGRGLFYSKLYMGHDAEPQPQSILQSSLCLLQWVAGIVNELQHSVLKMWWFRV